MVLDEIDTCITPEQDNDLMFSEQGILFWFFPLQGGKFKTPVAHTCLIKAESPIPPPPPPPR